MRPELPFRLLLLASYGAALLLSAGWHDHGHGHKEETAAEHQAHIVGESAHLGLHIDSLPADHGDHHAPDCPTCAFLTQSSVVEVGLSLDGEGPTRDLGWVEDRPAARLWSLPSRARGPPALA